MEKLTIDLPRVELQTEAVCTVCGEKLYHRLCIPGREPRMVRKSCRCRQERRQQEEAQKRRMEFEVTMDRLRERYPITDRDCRAMTFAADDRRDAAIGDVCRKYVEQWEEMKRENIGMLFYGSVGTGKTYFGCAVVNALLDRQVPAAVTGFPRLLNLLQSERDRQGLIDHLHRYELLLIDDLGVERDTAYAMEQVYAIIDARARVGLPLLITTNLSLQELKNPATTEAARIYDRVLELCPITLKMTGESRRKEQAERKKARARQLLQG